MSITSTPFRPKVWMPGYNNIIWNFISNKTAEPNFSYVIDIFVQEGNVVPTTRTYRLFQRPSPNLNCMVDVSDLVQAYFSLSPWTNGEGLTTQYHRFGSYNTQNAILGVFLKVGEQYEVNGVLTIFNGNTDVQGDPAYTAYSAISNTLVRVLPSALTYAGGVQALASGTNTGVFTPYVMDGNGEFLTYFKENNVKSGQTHTLSFLNWWDAAPGSYAYGIQGIQIDYYNSANALITSDFYQNSVSAGGGPQTNSNYTTLTYDQTTAALSFRCGPGDITVPSGTVYYLVTAYRKSSATSSTTPGTIASESIRLNMTTYCEDLYPIVRISWLNELGGRDYYNFDMFYEKTTSTPGDVWYQEPINWASTTSPVPLNTDSDKTGQWLKGGKKSFGKTVTTRFTAQTDWILQETVDLLGQISQSPSVWAYIGSSTTPETIEVTSIDYVFSNVKQQKLVQVTLECEVTKTQSKQNM